MILPLSVNPTAAAQGALAIEIRSDRQDLKMLLAHVNCAATYRAVESERQVLAAYGGGCHQKIGVSRLTRPYGDIVFLRGLTDAGEVLNRAELVTPVSAATGDARIFPLEGEAFSFFRREELPPESWRRAIDAPALWVARETAWPRGLPANHDRLVWTAGLTTWRKLSDRGIWVHGTSDGLGEREETAIETLAEAQNDSRPTWLKLTHEDSASEGEDDAACATYRLVAIDDQVPNLSGRTHFYWMSGTSFDRALALFPEIASAHHASGPGRTHERLLRRLGPARVSVHLNVEDFRARFAAHQEKP